VSCCIRLPPCDGSSQLVTCATDSNCSACACSHHPTCHAEPCAYWLVQEEHAVLSVPASRVLLQGQVCLQGKGTVEVEGPKQAGTPRTTLQATTAAAAAAEMKTATTSSTANIGNRLGTAPVQQDV
jgi:hypothetical protein